MALLPHLIQMKNRIFGHLLPLRTAEKARDFFLTPRRFPVRIWEKEKEAQGRRFAINDSLSAITWGASKRKILLVHGWESRATQLAGFVDPLVLNGFQVVAVDAPAHGFSLGKQSTPLMFAEAIQTVDQQIGPFDGILGLSMGGSAIGINLSQGLNSEKAVLISSPSSIIGVLQRFAQLIGLPPKSASTFIRLVGEAVGVPAKNLNIAEKLKGLQHDGLIIHDIDDQEVPVGDAKSINRSWTSSKLILTRGFGHRSIVRQPKVWNQVAAFFSNITAGHHNARPAK
jgi:pimeloyl-ACP methyl ester carboxylesterase